MRGALPSASLLETEPGRPHGAGRLRDQWHDDRERNHAQELRAISAAAFLMRNTSNPDPFRCETRRFGLRRKRQGITQTRAALSLGRHARDLGVYT